MEDKNYINIILKKLDQCGLFTEREKQNIELGLRLMDCDDEHDKEGWCESD